MTTGERIKRLRESLGMTQVSLADAIGEKKQTLYKYENNCVTNIPIDKIELIAKTLNTSPAYLMGWDDPQEIAPGEQALTEGEKTLLELFRKIPSEQQEMVLQMIRAALNAAK